MDTRVPMDSSYVMQLGKAVYVFSYYEWTIIWIIEHLTPGFLHGYSRGQKSMTSGYVSQEFRNALDQENTREHAKKDLLERCCNEFRGLIPKRNALIHAHPITDIGGTQILNYQADVSNLISDMKWDIRELERFIEDVDSAVDRASELLDQLVTKSSL